MFKRTCLHAYGLNAYEMNEDIVEIILKQFWKYVRYE